MEGPFIFGSIALLVALIVAGYIIRNNRKRKESIKPATPTPDPLTGWDATKIDVPQVPVDGKSKADRG
jgi:hypothetical protein